MYYATRGSYCSALRTGMVTCVNHVFPKGKPSGFLGSCHCIFCTFFLGLFQQMLPRWKKLIPFLKPHPVTKTPGWPRKIAANVFPKNITPLPGQDSNPGTSGPNPDALNTTQRQQASYVGCMYGLYRTNVWKRHPLDIGSLLDRCVKTISSWYSMHFAKKISIGYRYLISDRD